MSRPASVPGIELHAGSRALREGRGDVSTLIALGVHCLEAGDARTAAAFARAAGAVDRARRAPQRLLGLALAQLGEYDEAIATLRESLLGADTANAESALSPDLTRGSESAELNRPTMRGTDDASLEPGPLDEGQARLALGRVLCAMSRANDAIAEFELAVRRAPQSAVALAWLGEAFAQARRYPQALDALNRAILLDPAYGRAHTSLGEALIEVGRPAAALKALDRALALDTQRAAPAIAFAQALARMGKLAEALPWFNRAVEIEPTNAEAFRHMGRTLAALRFDKEALDCIRAARQLHGDEWPDAWMDEAGLLLRRGDFRAGWRAYENREFAQRLSTIVPPLWNGDDPVAGESLLLIAEQGLGDTFQFIRFAPRVAALGAKVTVEVQPPLRELFRRCYAGTGVEIIARGDAQPAATRQNSLVGMPFALQADVQTYADEVPYLHASDDRTRMWRERLDARAARAAEGTRPPRLRVGLVASGNPRFRMDADRSMPLAEMAPLLARDDIHWTLVQPELRERDRATLDAHPSVWWVGDDLRDFDDTAALLESLDLVISVDTGVAHLSGAMGRPVWVLLPYFGDWRWMHDRADSPWYPSARLFRQTRPQDWASVVDEVAAALATFEPAPRDSSSRERH